MKRSILLVLALATALLGADSVVTQAKQKVAEKKFDEAIAMLDKAYKAKATPELSKALADASMAKADDAMFGNSLPPREKYPTALRSYREVLKYDKLNTKAKESIATIEGIYKQMGRPIPQ
jgi:tetratricopeptide (TPR) repeat protein